MPPSSRCSRPPRSRRPGAETGCRRPWRPVGRSAPGQRARSRGRVAFPTTAGWSRRRLRARTSYATGRATAARPRSGLDRHGDVAEAGSAITTSAGTRVGECSPSGSPTRRIRTSAAEPVSRRSGNGPARTVEGALRRTCRHCRASRSATAGWPGRRPPRQGGEGSRIQIVAWTRPGVGMVETRPARIRRHPLIRRPRDATRPGHA